MTGRRFELCERTSCWPSRQPSEKVRIQPPGNQTGSEHDDKPAPEFLPFLKTDGIHQLAGTALATSLDTALFKEAVVVTLQEVGFNLAQEVEENPDDNQETGAVNN